MPSPATGDKPPGKAAGGIGAGGTSPPVDPQPRPQIDGNAGLSDGPGAPAVQSAWSWALGGVKSFWTKLPKWGKVAAIAATPLLLVIVPLLGGGGRDRESYEFGYGQGTSGMMRPENRIGSAEEACDSLLDYWISLPSRKDIDKGDAMDGCLDGTSGRPPAPGG